MRAAAFLLNFLNFLVEIKSCKNFKNNRMGGENVDISVTTESKHCAQDFLEEWFMQKLDHFNPTDETTWKQRYYTNEQFHNPKEGGPVFLIISGEGSVSLGSMRHASWVNYAESFGALLFQLEHRYYGKSHPTKNLSTENLKYLTSQQALADLATFITAMNKKYNLPLEVKWIAFGCSYAGSLAAWLRSKYPHLVHGAVSSSAPLLAKVDFPEFYRIVSESLATHSNDCITTINEGFDKIDTLLRQEPEILNRIFNVCDPSETSISNDLDISAFYERISRNFAGVVQDYRIDNHKRSTIDLACDIMVNQTLGSPVNRIGKVQEAFGGEECLNYKYEKEIKKLRNTNWKGSEDEGERQWAYQICTEFGFFQTSTQASHIFSDTFPINFFTNSCANVFGDMYNADFLVRAVNRTNMFYGGLDIEVSNVVFVHGSHDPWQVLGITRTINPASAAIYVQGTAHCADLAKPTFMDPAELTEARRQIQDFIATLLKP